MKEQIALQRAATVEWPTLALFAVIYASWTALVIFHAAIPLWLWLPLAAWTSAWWGSAQHEALHGHPTRFRQVNAILATPPVWLWIPFERYRQTHLRHHRDERLTDPLDDPESRYKCPDGWRRLGPVGQALVDAQTTLLGRLVIGPFWSIGVFWLQEALAIRAGDGERARIWLRHALWTAALLGVALGAAGMPLWQYLLGFVYAGTALALIRSVAEHKAEAAVEKRTAIVERSPLFSLLFLNNNLHVAHHKWPTAPWYRLPALYRAHREALIHENGGLVYDGYADVFRRFFLRRHDRAVHPLGRVPEHRGGESIQRSATPLTSPLPTGRGGERASI